MKNSLDFIFAILYYSDRDWFFERSGYEGERKRMTVKRVIEYPHMDGHTNYKLVCLGQIVSTKIPIQWWYKKDKIVRWSIFVDSFCKPLNLLQRKEIKNA